jgi:thiamine transporter ThiT
VGIAAATGLVIQLIPIHSMYRWALCGLAAIAILAIPVYMSGLEYTVPF